ncbi:DUF1631 domain-containing protein [Litoribrevibacter albus]|uniref:DUF1631 domain-containing protein n=1 Tax=Litoribrevibacter albus TaxID=1473156 RepID=A0AA37SF30_9GAMM|nr:DUF1631 domain-containing protein [Litoribrevibacter albus]GLQ33377.1 hypothetical protein GCM10007876_38570 [Litoribrevibacter albus]
MSPQDKVVSINPGVTTNVKGLSVPVKAYSDLAQKELKLLLRAMFDSADDTLFKLSDKASSNEQQERYFNAMRAVRLKRRQMETKFFEGFRKSFDDLASGVSVAARQQDKVSMESLSLVQNDELEERVALETMSNKATSANKTTLSYLNKRIGYLLSREDMVEADNPTAPINLCDYFADCIHLLELEIEARLIVYKLFDQFVLSKLSDLYEALDTLLVTHGALPDLTPKKRQTSSTTSNGTPAQGNGGYGNVAMGGAPAGDIKPIFRSLQKLLSQVQLNSSDVMVAAPNYQGPTQSVGQICQALSIVELPSSGDENELQGWLNFDVREHLRGAMREQGHNGRALPMSRKDNDAINLVAMLFEFILEDRNITPSIRAILARLQLPLVKLALQDQRFFDQKSHPARSLLNALASAAVGFNHQSDRFQERLRFKIEEVVNRVCNDFETNLDLFEMLLADFQVFQEKEAHRVALVTQRLQDAEEGKAKTEKAREWVKTTLSRVTEAYRPLPEFIETLLSDAWSKVLFLNVLKSGYESDEWKEAVFTIEQMLWTVAGEHTRMTRPVLLKVIPMVQKKLRKGLNDVSFNPYDSSRLLKELETLQINMLKEASTRDGTAEQAEASKDYLVKNNNPGERLRESDEELSASETMAAIDQVLTQQSQDHEDDSLAEYLQKVDEFGTGSWFRMTKDDGEVRTKLAAALPKLNKYILVNHAGMKVHECTRAEFAKMLRDGRISLIDNGAVFDRALKSVVQNLRMPKS